MCRLVRSTYTTRCSGTSKSAARTPGILSFAIGRSVIRDTLPFKGIRPFLVGVVFARTDRNRPWRGRQSGFGVRERARSLRPRAVAVLGHGSPVEMLLESDEDLSDRVCAAHLCHSIG